MHIFIFLCVCNRFGPNGPVPTSHHQQGGSYGASPNSMSAAAAMAAATATATATATASVVAMQERHQEMNQYGQVRII